LFTVAISYIRPSVRLPEILFRAVIFSIILNFPTLLGSARPAVVFTLNLLLVATGHVPLRDGMVESLEAWSLAESVGWRNLVAHVVVEKWRLGWMLPWQPERWVGFLRDLMAWSTNRSTSDVLRRAWVNLRRRHSLLLLHCLQVVYV
jgi:hypothetical protein